MRVLFLANDFPTTHEPAAASWVTGRLEALARRPDVEVHAAALRTVYPRRLAPVARRAGVVPADSFLLADTGTGRMFHEIECRWTSIDVGMAWPRQAPDRVLARATSAVAGRVLGAREPYDVIHAHGMHDVAAGEVARRVSARFSIPYVVSVHATDAASLRQTPRSCARALNLASATVYPTRRLLDDAADRGLPTGHARVHPEGFDPVLFRPVDRRTWRLTMHGLRLLFVGDLDADHGADRLPRILQRVRRRNPDTRLEVVGEGALRGRLERALPDVAFHGNLDEPSLAQVMRGCDVLVQPGLRATRPSAVAQAYGSGLVVVAADGPGVVDALLPGTEALTWTADFDQRFADAIAHASDTAPAPAELVAHAAKSAWDRIVDGEVELLAAARHAGSRA